MTVKSLPGPPAPIAVVLDSNAIWHQWWLTGKSWDHLGTLVEQARIDLYVPEVVVQEVVRGRQHDANDLVVELNKLDLYRIERLLRLGLPTKKNELASKVQELVAGYDTELRARLDQLKATIVAVPSVSHQVVLTRALEKRRPFDADGRNGYRDVLIWHSLLDVIERGYEGIVFVTKNTRDFCFGKPPVLHPALTAEISAWAPDVAALIATEVPAVGARVEEIERSLGEHEVTLTHPQDSVIRNAISECIDIIVGGLEPPAPGRWGEDLDNGWQLRSILEEDPMDVVSIEPDLDSLECDPAGEVEFNATVGAEVTFDGFAFKGDVYTEADRISIEVQDADWNDHYMHVREYHDANLTFRVRLNENGTAAEECWLEEAVERPQAGDETEGPR